MDIYCDGASRKDGRGGWGFVVYDREGVEIECKHGGAYNTTNNRMEMRAAIKALKWVSDFGTSPVTLHLDSKYVLDGITEHIDIWLRTGWLTSSGRPVKNQDLWERLAELDLEVTPKWKHVKGHSGVVGNERADELAGLGIPEPRQGAQV